MGQVATVATPLTQGQALGALLAGGCPSSALLMAAAQSAVETNAWGSLNGKGFHNFNFGNETPSQGQLAAGIAWMDQGIKGMKYIAFGGAIAGAQDYVNFLAKRGLLALATANNLDGYMAQLQASCYLGCVGNTDPTGHTVSATDYANYRAGIVSWMNKLRTVTPVAPPGAGLSIAEMGLVAAGVVAAGLGAVAVVRPEWLRLI